MAGEMLLLVVCVVLASVSVIIEVVVGVDIRPQQQHLIGHQPA